MTRRIVSLALIGSRQVQLDKVQKQALATGLTATLCGSKGSESGD